MNLEYIIKKGITAAFKELFNSELPENQVILQPTNKEFEGTHTFVVFPFLKISKKAPEQTALILGEWLQKNVDVIEKFNAVKGFLNLSISDSAWIQVLSEEVLSDSFGVFPAKGEKVMVEYSSPNTNKPLHLGHLRNNFLGYAVSEILKAYGYEVIKANLINDRGIHICKSMLAYQKYGNGETPESSGMKGDHLVGKYYVRYDQEYKKQVEELKNKGFDEEKAKQEAPVLLEAQEMLKKWEESDEQVVALWKTMNSWVYQGFEETYRKIGVQFDKYYYESDTYLLGKDIVEEGLQKGIFFKKENGSVWIDLADEGLDEKLLLRADGTSVYITQDLGTADLKYKDYGMNRSIYVVGNEQDYHFKVLQLILRKLRKPYADGIYHLSYGMVDLPSGKMKSREGTVVDADELVQEMNETAASEAKAHGKTEGFSEEELSNLFHMIGMGALKFFLLKVDPKKRMLFNPQESIEFQGNTGPFIQYTHARIRSVIRKAEQQGFLPSNTFGSINSLTQEEKDVIVLLQKYPERIKAAAENYSPAEISQYVFDLAKEYNKFYQEITILNEPDQNKLLFRLAFSKAVADTLKRAMSLLGIDVPEKM